MYISYQHHSLEWPEKSCCKLPMWLNPVHVQEAQYCDSFSKTRIENKHQEQGAKPRLFLSSILTFGNRKALGKFLLGNETFENFTLCNPQEWLRGTHQEGSCGPGPLLLPHPGLVLWLLFDCEGEQGAWESPQQRWWCTRCRDGAETQLLHCQGQSQDSQHQVLYVPLQSVWTNVRLRSPGVERWTPFDGIAYWPRTSYLRPNKVELPEAQQGRVTWGPTRA